MKIGASYYPEILPETDWAKDLETGRQIGLGILRCGEFAWSALFTSEGKATVDWVPRFLDTAAAHGYEVIWCTPSATPPPIGSAECEGVPGPLALELKVGKGRILVALTALNSAGVQALLKMPSS